MLPIAVDAMGGDHAPAEIVAGAVAAYRDSEIPITLVGHAARVRALLAEHGAARDIPIVPAEDALSMDAGALASLRRPRSSIAVACHLLRCGEAAAVVSAGPTGGIVATGRLRLRSLPGVARPAIAVLLPTRPRPTVLLDAGATPDAKPEMLVQFALLGTAYAQTTIGVERPRVGLLTIGAEPGKGNRLTRRASSLLAATPIDFVGNVEGSCLLTGVADVIVTDGFTGNVALKTVEGGVRFALGEVRDTLREGRVSRAAALFQRRRLERLRERLDPETTGGAVLLGLAGTVVIAHGATTARGITSACELARTMYANRIVERMREDLAPPPRRPRFNRELIRERDTLS